MDSVTTSVGIATRCVGPVGCSKQTCRQLCERWADVLGYLDAAVHDAEAGCGSSEAGGRMRERRGQAMRLRRLLPLAAQVHRGRALDGSRHLLPLLVQVRCGRARHSSVRAARPSRSRQLGARRSSIGLGARHRGVGLGRELTRAQLDSGACSTLELDGRRR
jgi:hypothetical protein